MSCIGCASTSEMAVYHMHATQLRLLGAEVGPPQPASYRGRECTPHA